ncbi:hypothetical protein F5B20DRAFT_531322 [Whalleya microplaca]|nr:hypothetical protein F5B20DRAFT_531322 [Whalleya microplaca]
MNPEQDPGVARPPSPSSSSPGSAKKKDISDLFPLFPNELKFEIFRHAAQSPGVHHFKLQMLCTDEEESYAIVPIAGPNNDPSVWRERRNIKAVNSVAYNALWPYYHDRKELYSPRGRSVVAKVDGDNDLIHFRTFSIWFDAEFTPIERFRPLFSGLKRVAIEWKPQRNDYTFTCVCEGRTHTWENGGVHMCYASIADFLRYFPDIENFYLLLKLNKKDVVDIYANRKKEVDRRKSPDLFWEKHSA